MTSPNSSTPQLTSKKIVEQNKFIERRLKSCLKSSDYSVLRFIADRTLSFYKTTERIPMRHFLQGFKTSSGEVITTGVGLSRSTVKRSLARLYADGLITRSLVKSSFGDGYEYSLDWRGSLAFVEEREALRKSDAPRKNSGTQSELRGGSKRPQTGVKMTPHNNRKKTTDPNNGSTRFCAVGRQKDGLNKNSEDITPSTSMSAEYPSSDECLHGHGVADAIAAGQRVTNDNMRKLAERPVSAKVIEDIWNTQMQQSWSTVRLGKWTGRMYGNAKSLIEQVGKNNVQDFVEWSIKNWPLVKRSKFPPQGEIDCPKYPDFIFFFALHRTFKDVWEDREFMRSLADNPKAGLIVWLKNQGYSEEDAIEEAGQRDKHKERMEELAAAKKEIEALHRQVGLVYSPDQGIKYHAKDAEERIKAGEARKAIGEGAREGMQPHSELGKRIKNISGWDD